MQHQEEEWPQDGSPVIGETLPANFSLLKPIVCEGDNILGELSHVGSILVLLLVLVLLQPSLLMILSEMIEVPTPFATLTLGAVIDLLTALQGLCSGFSLFGSGQLE